MMFPLLLCIGYDVLLWWYFRSPWWCVGLHYYGDIDHGIVLLVGLNQGSECFLMLVLSIVFIVLWWQWVLCYIRNRLLLRYVMVFVSTIFGWSWWHWDIHRCGIQTLRCAFVALHNSHPLLIHKKNDLLVTSFLHAFGENIMSFNYVNVVGSCH